MKTLRWPTENISSMKKLAPAIKNIQEFLKYFDNPEKKLPPIIHITGTNGKGSVTAFLKAILEENGYKVHRYTSPHLININERIELAGKPITDKYFEELQIECEKINKKYPARISYFEAITAMAFLAFSRIPADVVILEVGIGGKWDATNIIENPIASIITPISLDHTSYLGNTVEKIADEKAGIFKKNCPAIISKQQNNVYEVLIDNAKQKNCPIYQYDKDWFIKDTKDGFTFNYKEGKLILPKPSLEGQHQLLNAGTAIMALLAQKKLKINKDTINKAITKTIWPARLQNLENSKIFKQYLDNNYELWLDGGHNEGASKIIANWLDEKNKHNKKITVAITGMLEKKDSKAFLENLKNSIDYAIAIRIHSEDAKTKDENEYMAEMQEKGINAIAIENYKNALLHIKEKYKNQQVRIVICGSLYLAGEVLEDL